MVATDPPAHPAPARRAGYNPAIDGLRAFAVVSVFLFHLDRDVLRGGFVGVDIFFVISGYLITGMLDRGGTVVNPGGQTSVAAIGDSESAMYGTALRGAAAAQDWKIRLLGAADTNELPGEPDTRWPAVARWLDRDRPQIVVITEAWAARLGDGAGLAALLTHIGAWHARAILVLQPPLAQFPAGSLAHASYAMPLPQDRAAALARLAANRKVASIASRYGAAVVDPARLFLTGAGRVSFISAGYQADYYDPTHLSEAGARRVLPAIFAAAAAPALPPQLAPPPVR